MSTPRREPSLSTQGGAPSDLLGRERLPGYPPQPGGPGAGSTILSFLHLLRRRLPIFLVCVIAVPLVALLYSLHQESEYRSTAALLFRTAALNQNVPGSSLLNNSEDPTRAAETNVNLVSLGAVAARTAKKLDEPGVTPEAVAGSVSVSLKGESEIADVSATTPSPDLSARMANVFAAEYVNFSQVADSNRVLQAKNQVESRLEGLAPEEREGREGQELERQARQLGVLAALQTGDAEVVQQAVPDTTAVTPQTTRNVVLGIMAGLLLGIGLTFLVDQLDTRIKDEEGIEAAYGLPILARIPQVSDASGEKDSVDLPVPLAESFRMLHANLRYFNFHRKVDSLAIVSTASQEGKSSVSWGLALTEARAGKSVLLIEADLRQPTLAARLPQRPESGLSLVLAGLDTLEDATVAVQVGGAPPADLHVLPAGPTPPNAAELLESPAMSALLAEAREQYDLLVIDTPPVLVADAIPIMSQVGGVVVVARLRATKSDAARDMRELLGHVGASALGVVVNGAPLAREGYYMPRAADARAKV